MKNLRKKIAAITISVSMIAGCLPTMKVIPVYAADSKVESRIQGSLAAEAVDKLNNQITVNVKNNPDSIKAETDDAPQKMQVYSVESAATDFEISLQRDFWTQKQIQDYMKNKAGVKPGQKGKIVITTDKKVEINSINKIRNEINGIFDELGISVNELDGKKGVCIEGLPYGANLIEYSTEFEYTTLEFELDENGDLINFTDSEGRTNPYKIVSVDKEKNINKEQFMINSGTGYISSKNTLDINQYVGGRAALDKDIENNKSPLKYIYRVLPDLKESKEEVGLTAPKIESPARFQIDLFDSSSALDYIFSIDDVAGTDGSKKGKVYINGVEDKKATLDSADGTSSIVKGEITSINDVKYVTVKLPEGDSQGSYIRKVYSFELRFKTANRNQNFSLKEMDVKKFLFDADPKVKAYIGKKFTIIDEDSHGELNFMGNTNVKIYEGDITIDNAAEQISIIPMIQAGNENIIADITSSYIDETGSHTCNYSIGKDDGRKYVEFRHGGQITISLYEKKGATDDDKGALLAKYVLHVKAPEEAADVFNIDLTFDENKTDDKTYLKQQGVDSVEVEFNKYRNNYNLYTTVNGMVTIGLPNRTSRNEYIRIWKSDALSGGYEEIQASVDNVPVNGIRNQSLVVEYGKAKRLKVQAFYDEFDADGNLVAIHPASSTYEFFMMNNISSSDKDENEKSDNAYLSSIKVKGQNLLNFDTGEKGFDRDIFKYRVVVPKNAETATLTVMTEDPNARTITAVIKGTDVTYDLTAGEETEFMLNKGSVTEVEIIVTAENGKTTQTYTVVIENNSKGSDSLLKNLILSSGELDFDPNNFVINVQVEYNVNKLSLTPVPLDPKASVSVGETKYAGKPVQVSLAGSQLTTVDIKVVSEDGKNQNTYTVKIKRVTQITIDNDKTEGETEDIYYDYDNQNWVNTSKYDEWGVINDKVMYFDKKGQQVKDRWIKTNNTYYYINEAGYRGTGWKIDNETGQRYYLDDVTGAVKLGWMYLDGSWYYLGKTGIMQTGWLYLDNNWYYFTQYGEMIANETMYIDGKIYKFAADGKSQVIG